jgi:hypothetical protein
MTGALAELRRELLPSQPRKFPILSQGPLEDLRRVIGVFHCLLRPFLVAALRLGPMPIPELTPEGLLPAGIFDSTVEEIRQRFGTFQGSDRRPRLFARLQQFVVAIRNTGLFEAVLIDGSFVTGKPAPNDIDVIAVLHRGHDFERVFSMFEYAFLSRQLLRQRFGFDVVLVEEHSPLYDKAVEFFGRVRESTHLRKGLLRLVL